MNEWGYCPTCKTQTDSEKREGNYCCTSCQNVNPFIQEAAYGKQTKVETQDVRG